MDNHIFRSAFNGFNRQDVAAYIEKSQKEAAERAAELETQLEALRKSEEALRAELEKCEQELNWKRTTTYTVLKKLCDRGIFAMSDRMITVLITRDEFRAMQSEQFVEDAFQGSLPAFLAAFTTRKALTEEEVEKIRALIDAF